MPRPPTYFRDLQSFRILEFLAIHENRQGVWVRTAVIGRERYSIPMDSVGSQVWLDPEGGFTDQPPEDYIDV